MDSNHNKISGGGTHGTNLDASDNPTVIPIVTAETQVIVQEESEATNQLQESSYLAREVESSYEETQVSEENRAAAAPTICPCTVNFVDVDLINRTFDEEGEFLAGNLFVIIGTGPVKLKGKAQTEALDKGPPKPSEINTDNMSPEEAAAAKKAAQKIRKQWTDKHNNLRRKAGLPKPSRNATNSTPGVGNLIEELRS
ncbi:hypothetical protein B0T21DRAFT_390633 [Apiosordaria backusii]|uniref:Uncharacterized protein n=1 Tax=Apiosordaria backusii TaxID=314023 RepID=A0AA40ELW9_9PEZI|nr:hypothetical protein B0T21DRAFT_390633 [Apiosordaria backusii]